MAKHTGNILSGAKLSRPGTKLNRSETVSIRLDPRLNYLCELAARSQRRTKSSFIEATIAEKIDSMNISNWRDLDYDQTLGERAGYLWHVRERERLISLGLAAPHLMTFEEQEIWAAICETGYFWRGHYSGNGEIQHWKWTCDEGSINRSSVEDEWEKVLLVAQGEVEMSELPQVRSRNNPKAASGSGSNTDDEIPF